MIRFFLEIAEYLSNPLVLIGFGLLVFYYLITKILSPGAINALSKRANEEIIKKIINVMKVSIYLLIALGFVLEYLTTNNDIKIRTPETKHERDKINDNNPPSVPDLNREEDESESSYDQDSVKPEINNNDFISQEISPVLLTIEVSREVENLSISIDNKKQYSINNIETISVPVGYHTILISYQNKLLEEFEFSKKYNLLEDRTLFIKKSDFKKK